MSKARLHRHSNVTHIVKTTIALPPTAPGVDRYMQPERQHEQNSYALASTTDCRNYAADIISLLCPVENTVSDKSQQTRETNSPFAEPSGRVRE